MNIKGQKAALAAKTSALRATVTTFNGANIDVDEKAGILRNVAAMNVGEASGHGFLIDLQTLEQTRDLINAAGPDGVKMRLGHPEPNADGSMPDDITEVIGSVKNARIEGESLRVDVHLGDYAKVLPGRGDVKTYLLLRAQSNPRGFGLSAVIGYDAEPVLDAAGSPMAIVARVFAVDAVDAVGRGAATPNGLLAANKPTEPKKPATAPVVLNQQPALATARATNLTRKGNSMNAKLKAYLSAHHGLAADASDEDAQKLFDGLAAEAQTAAMAAVEEEDKAQMAAAASATTAAATALATRQVSTQSRPRSGAGDDDADAQFIALEQKRITGINQLVAALKQGGAEIPAALIQQQIGANATLITARAAFLKHIAENCTPIASVKVGEDRNRASLKAAIGDAILIRAGQKIEKPADRAQQLASLTVIDMGRKYLAAYGVNEANDVSRIRVWEMLAKPQRFGGQYAMLAQSTDSFANITLDAANKALRMEYSLAPSTWNIWARRATAPDFKNINRIQLSDVPGLVARKEGGEIKYNVLSDNKEVYTLAEYINGVRLTRQAMVNDDLDAFSRIPRAQATTAKQLEDDVCYAILTANAALSDTGALFNATAVTTAGGHANLDSATANVGAPSVTTLGRGRQLMRLQKGPKSNLLNLTPKFLLVPAALETVADQYTSVNYVAAVQTSINPFAGNGRTPLTPVVEPRLDASSATAWYLAADNSRVDTVEVCFLQDEQEPQLKSETDFDTDDLKFAVRHTVAAKAIDFRGLYKNNGA